MSETPKCRVLVVDDNLDQVNSLTLLLQHLGYEVESAINGFSAMASSRTFQPDVVLLDIGLPDTDGLEVAKLLRNENRKTPLRIFAVTARSAPEDRRKAIAAGFDRYLIKPVDPQVLHRLLAEPPVRKGADAPPV